MKARVEAIGPGCTLLHLVTACKPRIMLGMLLSRYKQLGQERARYQADYVSGWAEKALHALTSPHSAASCLHASDRWPPPDGIGALPPLQDGNTALHIAAASGMLDRAKMLHDRAEGADIPNKVCSLHAYTALSALGACGLAWVHPRLHVVAMSKPP